MHVATRGGVLVSWDNDEVLQVGPSEFASRFDNASRIYVKLKDEFPIVKNKCMRLNLYKGIPSG